MSSSERALPSPAGREAAAEKVRAANGSIEALTQQLQLEGLHLVYSNFFARPEFPELAKDRSRLQYRFEVAASSFAYDREVGHATIGFTWRVFVLAPGAKLEKLPGYGDQIVEVAATYMLEYAGVPNLDEETVKNFVDMTGEFASYPYFRTLVGQFGWLGGVELPILPVITNRRRAPRAAQPAPVSLEASTKTQKRRRPAPKAKP